MEHNNAQEILDQIKLWSNKSPSIEICGFVGFDKENQKYVAQLEKNCSTEPNLFFAIDALRYLLFKQKYESVSVFHSHVVGDSEPSEFDIKMSENCCMSFLIYSINTKKFNIYEPQNKEYDVKILQGIKDFL